MNSKGNMNLVTIITVCYNSQETIKDTIESVLIQDYPKIQYIIIDGYSKDNTVSIIRRYEDEFRKKGIEYTWISEKDAGLSDAMNKGVNYASGKFIMHLHSDDVLINSESISMLMENCGIKTYWVTGFYKYIDDKNEIIKKDKVSEYNFFDMLIGNKIRHQATIVNREVFESFRFDGNYKYAMDYDFFLQVWCKYGGPLIIKQYITYFRLNGKNLSSNYISSLKDEMRARKSYRTRNGEKYMILCDYVIYFMRKIKIYTYHRRKKYFDKKDNPYE